MRSFRQAVAPIAVVAGPACLLIVVEPDLGTTLVVALTIAVLLIAGRAADALHRRCSRIVAAGASSCSRSRSPTSAPG